MTDLTRPKVVITKRGVERADSGHLWIYRSDVKSNGGAVAGDAVRVVDERGWFVALALYSGSSQITLRILTRADVEAEALLDERLGLAVEFRKRFFSGVSGVRLVHGEGDLLPGLIADKYGDVIVMQTLTAATDRRKQHIAEELVKLTGATAVVERNDVAARRHESLDHAKRGMLVGNVDAPVAYAEGEVKLVADVIAGQKTGAFLDQRDNHILAGRMGSGKALDCFAYHGGFSLQLARTCESVVSVDSSEPALATLRENAARNGLTNVTTKTVNAFDYLRERSDAKEKFDTIVLDPPAFTKNKESIDAATRGYKEINLRAMSMLPKGGLLVTASCSYHVDEAAFEALLLSAAIDAGRKVQVLDRRGAGADHPVLLGVPETRYLKCMFVRLLD